MVGRPDIRRSAHCHICGKRVVVTEKLPTIDEALHRHYERKHMQLTPPFAEDDDAED